MEVKKVVWASVLGALSVVIDVAFKNIVPLETMGTPYYAIPIIIASIFLGPKYSISIAFLGDLISVLLSPFPYLPIFSLGSLMWGLIPGFLLKDKYSFKNIILVVFLTHILVTSINSLALYVHYHKSVQALLIDLPLRSLLIIPNTIIISLLVEGVLEPIKIKRGII